MANKHLAALILRLLGIYWIVAGTLGVFTAGIAIAFDDGSRVRSASPTLLGVVMAAAAVYPIAGLLLLRFADRLAMRLCTAPESAAPIQFALGSGLSLLGVYFFVWGLHDAIDVIFQIRLVLHEASLSALGAFFFEPLAKTIIFLVAGATLTVQPRWLASLVSRVHSSNTIAG